MKVFCAYCGKTEQELTPYLAYFTKWDGKLSCLECWKALKFEYDNRKGAGAT